MTKLCKNIEILQEVDIIVGIRYSSCLLYTSLGTDAQNRIVEVARNSEKYGISAAGGYCEAWAEEVYRKAGVSIDRHCCAGKNRALYTVGKSSKNIPLGAMVYNDPAVYQSRTNDICGRNAGHVGIYIGNGQIISNIGGTVIAVSYTHLDVYKRQESSIRAAQERSKKSVTGRLKEIACAEIDEQTENLVASLGDTQVDYRFFLGFKLVVTDKELSVKDVGKQVKNVLSLSLIHI